MEVWGLSAVSAHFESWLVVGRVADILYHGLFRLWRLHTRLDTDSKAHVPFINVCSNAIVASA